MKPSDIPNAISIARIFLVLPLILLLLARNYAAALFVFCLAGISDGLDGYLARRYNWISRLGQILDPIGDKALLVSAYVMLAWLGVLPLWLAVLVIARDVIIISGALAYHFLIGRYDMHPTLLSKTNTVLQLMLVVLVLAAYSVYPMPQWSIEGMIILVVVATLSSGINYVWVWGRQALREREQ